MDIVVPTHRGHYECMEKFLDTFFLNCIDHTEVRINIIISREDLELFTTLKLKYTTHENINIHILSELVKKYDDIDMTESELLATVGKFTYQSLKKLYGVLETSNQYVCVFDSECLFIRKFKMRDYIEENKNKYFYCSKMTTNGLHRTRANEMQDSTNDILGTKDMNWYLELYMWILRRDVLLDIMIFLKNKYGKLTLINQELFIEYIYYLYYRTHENTFGEVEWMDTYQLVRENMSNELFKCWSHDVMPWCMFEHIWKHLMNANYEQLDAVCMIYEMIHLPITRILPNDRLNQLFLILCKDVKICVSEYCPEVYEMTMKDLFNKNIGLLVSGLHRNCDNIGDLHNFVYPLRQPIHYYMSSENNDIHRKLALHPLTKSIVINNSSHTLFFPVAKYLPPAKNTFIHNTTEMFYKKTQLIKYLTNYDIVINIRPDLVTLNQHLIDLILSIFKKYDENTLYTSKIYDSVGIADTFAAGSVSVMKYFLNIYNVLPLLVSKYVFNPELYVYHQIADNGMKIIPIDWDYKINWHGRDLLNATWRIETYNLLSKDNYENNFDEFLRVKTSSFSIIEDEIIRTSITKPDKKYILTNVTSNHNLYIHDEKNEKCICVSVHPTELTQFYIKPPRETVTRVNIKLNITGENINKDGSGWNIFTTPNSPIVCGRGNAGTWAQFYLDKDGEYYYILSFHSINSKNRDGTFGRYIGVKDGKLVSDLPKCNEALWIIK